MTHLRHEVWKSFSFLVAYYSFSVIFFMINWHTSLQKLLNGFLIWFRFLCYDIRAQCLFNFFLTLNIDIDLDLDKVFQTCFGSYLKNCWADHHQILTQSSWCLGLSDQAIKSRAVFTCYVRGTFYVSGYVPKKFFVHNFTTSCWNIPKFNV